MLCKLIRRRCRLDIRLIFFPTSITILSPFFFPTYITILYPFFFPSYIAFFYPFFFPSSITIFYPFFFPTYITILYPFFFPTSISIIFSLVSARHGSAQGPSRDRSRPVASKSRRSSCRVDGSLQGRTRG